MEVLVRRSSSKIASVDESGGLSSPSTGSGSGGLGVDGCVGIGCGTRAEPVGNVLSKSGSMIAGADGLPEGIGDGDVVVDDACFARGCA